MFQVQNNQLEDWDIRLKPIGEGSFEKEAFSDWYDRYKSELAHLDERLLEQWVYRHWHYSPYSFIPLNSLACNSEWFDGEWIIKNIFNDLDREYNAEHDYQAFTKNFSDRPHPTAAALDTGSWDYPVPVLYTPNGVISFDGEHPDVRYILIDGHSRMRYLNALLKRGVTFPKLELLVLKSPIT